MQLTGMQVKITRQINGVKAGDLAKSIDCDKAKMSFLESGKHDQILSQPRWRDAIILHLGEAELAIVGKMLEEFKQLKEPGQGDSE